MGRRHQIRELALQVLYQLDARGDESEQALRDALGGAPHGEGTKAEALELARAAWSGRERADALATELAPAWPTTRQPPVDRSIIRLAHCELASGRAPAAVAIDEAIELAKTFGTERSPAFINGVLDRMARRLAG